MRTTCIQDSVQNGKPMNKNKEIIKYEDAAEHVTNASGWVCKTCRRYYGKEKHLAQWCHATDFPCGTEGCTNRMTKPYTACESCRARLSVERDQARLDKAKLCKGDADPFVVGDEFYRDLDEYREAIEQGDIEPQEFAYLTRELSLCLDADDVWRDALERLEIEEPDAIDDPVGMDEFRAAVDKFVEDNKNLGWWVEDTSQKFRLPRMERSSKTGDIEYVCDARPPQDGWAPGNYSNKCMECGVVFVGDKRAVKCADCAYEEKTNAKTKDD